MEATVSCSLAGLDPLCTSGLLNVLSPVTDNRESAEGRESKPTVSYKQPLKNKATVVALYSKTYSL